MQAWPSSWWLSKRMRTSRELATSGHDLHAPRLMAAELTNALWRKARTVGLEHRAAGMLLANLPEIPVRWSSDEFFTAYALHMAQGFNHPVYDCMYLALAQRLSSMAVTADRRFANSVASTEHGESVLTLADYAKIR